jgi:hypothetical protein
VKKVTTNCQTGEVIEIELTDEEIAVVENDALSSAWSRLRTKRNTLLTKCDWTVLGDSPTSTAAWKVYRQALRDLPANTTDPFNVDWPTPPA